MSYFTLNALKFPLNQEIFNILIFKAIFPLYVIFLVRNIVQISRKIHLIGDPEYKACLSSRCREGQIELCHWQKGVRGTWRGWYRGRRRGVFPDPASQHFTHAPICRGPMVTIWTTFHVSNTLKIQCSTKHYVRLKFQMMKKCDLSNSSGQSSIIFV